VAGRSEDAAQVPLRQPSVREKPVPPTRRPLVRVRTAALLLPLCTIAVVGVVAMKTVLPGKQRVARTPQGASTGRPTEPSSAVAPRGVTPRPQSSSRPAAAKARPPGGRTLKPKRGGVAGVSATFRPKSPSPPVIAWHPVPRATFYWFQLNRVDLPGTRKILDAFPVRARIGLRARWVNALRPYRLTPGRYRWSVWPQFGPRDEPQYTKLLARGTLVIKRAPWLEKQ
jgi:hypothetical protein